MALEATWTLTEMITRNLSGGKGRPACEDDNLTAIYEPVVSKMWEPQRFTTLWASTACYRNSFTVINRRITEPGRHSSCCESSQCFATCSLVMMPWYHPLTPMSAIGQNPAALHFFYIFTTHFSYRCLF
jgi:hypothetical protein